MSHNLFSSICPENSIIYNKTQCSCSPGYMYNTTTQSCSLFSDPIGDQWVKSFVVKHSDVDQNYQKIVGYELVCILTPIVAMLVWLLLCGLVRIGELGDGRKAWFQIRWWISRLDVTFSTRHWLCESRVKQFRNEDQVMQRIKKRKMAVDRWHKLRRFVAYTYGSRLLNEDYNGYANGNCTCCNCVRGRRITIQDESALQSLSFSRQPLCASQKVLRDSSRIKSGAETNDFV